MSPAHAGPNGTGPVLLDGSDVCIVSPAALARWTGILLIEDDSARSARRGMAGVADGTSSMLLRIHRIDHDGARIVAERSYLPGSRAANATRRPELALDLLDAAKAVDGCVMVCGPTYGCSSSFLDGLMARGLDAIPEIRPSSIVAVERRGSTQKTPISSLLNDAQWHTLAVQVPGASREVTYSAARLGTGRLGTGPRGSLFAAQTGAITGVHRGTVLGLCLASAPSLEEIVQAAGWVRWTRSLVRRFERPAGRPGTAYRNGGQRAKNGSHPKLRANIALSLRHDQISSTAESMLAPSLKRSLATSSRTLNVVELFAGAGGMGLGFLLADRKSAKYRLIYSGEVDPNYVQTLRTNYAAVDRIRRRRSSTPDHISAIDLRSKQARDALTAAAAESGGADIVIGGPPCQGFSNANRNSWRSSNPHNELIDVYLSYVTSLSPKVFVLENVQGIHWTLKRGSRQARSSMLEHIVARMEGAGYDVFIQLLDAVWFGVPQFRSRFFVVGLHRDLGYARDTFGSWGPFPRPSHGPGTSCAYSTVHDAIGDLPPVGNGHLDEYADYAESDQHIFDTNGLLGFLRAGADTDVITDHTTSRHADYVIERYRRIPPGGNWESIADSLTNYSNVRRTHSNIYRRLVWDEPSITIGHYRKSMLVHPSQDRGLSLREAARLQSFPDWFRFAGNPRGKRGGLVQKQQQLANAVCPLVAKAIAEFILNL